MSQIPKYGTVYSVIRIENVTAIVYYIPVFDSWVCKKGRKVPI